MDHAEQQPVASKDTEPFSSPESGEAKSRQPHRRKVDDLIQRIKESADQLASDGPLRGDLKILSRALRELRYAFKVFSPYRRHRKVTVFGSARTRADEPAYEQAVGFGTGDGRARTGWSSPGRPAASWRRGIAAPAASTRWG